MIKEMQPEERPRERLRINGEQSLSTSELMAIILNTGIKGESVTAMSTRVVTQHGGLPGLFRMEFDELARVRGIGESKACRIKAALELGRRLAAAAPEERLTITGPEDVFRLFGVEMAALPQEQLRVVMLDTKHRVLRHDVIYQGSVNAAQVRVGEVFRKAIAANATAIIVAHNHPSGDPSPSAADISLTSELVQSGALLDIAVLDHIVIGQGRWVSMKRLGLGFRNEA
jgi:DNA repair protein RadC